MTFDPRPVGLAALAALAAAGLATTAHAARAPAVGPPSLPATPSSPGSPHFTPTIEGVDLSGVWIIDQRVGGGTGQPINERILKDANGQAIPTQPWAQKLYDDHVEGEKRGHTFVTPSTQCLPHGMPEMMTGAAYPIEIIQKPGTVAFIAELQHTWRIAHLDRGHLVDPDPTYYGDSVGHWEGDTLVIDTIGLNGKNVLDMLGMPTTDKMHVVERIRLLNPDKLDIDITIDDPGAYTEPWKEHVTYSRQPKEVELLEYICEAGNRNLVVDGKVTIDGQPRN
jgi:hypothetical protein